MHNKLLKSFYIICFMIIIPQTSKTLATNQITVQNSEIGVIIQIDNNLLFEDNNLNLRPRGYNTLDKIGEIIKNSNKTCIVESNTTKNKYKNSIASSDWELTIIRSDNIINYLINHHNINPQKLFSNGFGEKLPNQYLNNRTDFILKD